MVKDPSLRLHHSNSKDREEHIGVSRRTLSCFSLRDQQANSSVTLHRANVHCAASVCQTSLSVFDFQVVCLSPLLAQQMPYHVFPRLPITYKLRSISAVQIHAVFRLGSFKTPEGDELIVTLIEFNFPVRIC